MSASPESALRLTFIGVVAVIIAGALIVPLTIGIWLPDVFIDHTSTLAQARSTDGGSFRVIQYWNHGDFYNTELQHIAPHGSVSTHVIDPDDSKRWRASLSVDDDAREVTVRLRGRPETKFTW